MPTSLDRRALEVAAGQRWILTRAEAYAIGYTSEIIAYRLQSGTWQSIREGCYLVAPVKRDPRVYLEAAVHAIEGAIVSHESAAELYEMKYVPRGLAVVSVPPKTTHDFPGVIIRRPKDLAPDHIEEIDGMPVSTVLRTSFDLTGVYSYARVARILDDAIAAKLIDLHPVVKNHVYHPAFEGSFSLKDILKPLVPGLDYEDLEIEEGGAASVKLARLMFVAHLIPAGERDTLRHDLLEYCKRDTWATVKLLERLRELAAAV